MPKYKKNKAVVEVQERATGSSYAQRYQFDFASGQVVPRSENMPKALKRVTFVTEGTDVNAYVPALASGRVGMIPTFGMEDYHIDSIADWNPNRWGNDEKTNLRKALYWWKRDPLVKKCVAILSQLANTRLVVCCEDEAFRNIVDMWFGKAMPNSFRKSFFTERFRTEMVPVIKTLIPYKPRDYKADKIPQTQDGNVEPKHIAKASVEKTEEIVARNQTNMDAFTKAFAKYSEMIEMHRVGLCSAERLDKYAKSLAAAQYTWMKGHIAAAYAVLDPLAVDIEGPEELPWLRAPYLRISGELRNAVNSPNDQQRDVLSYLPFEVVQQIKNGADKVWLSPNIASVVFGSKQDYDRYPYPTVCHAEEALNMKYDLVAMDRSTARAIKDRILKVTVGNDEYPAFDDDQVKDIAQMFANPSRNLTLFWNHTLNIEWIEPKNTMLQDGSKYQHWNAEIRTAFGISETLTGTSSSTGAIGNSMLNLKGVEEAVGEGQDDFLEFANKEVDLLKQALGVKYQVTLSFDRSNMKDENTWLALMLQFVQNGLIDPQTAIETARFHFPTILARLEQTIKLRKKGLFVPMPSANNMGPDGGILPAGGQGKPATSPLANNNKNRAGKSQPKKAKAKLLSDERGIGAYLVLDQEVTAEDRAIAAETFGLPEELVMTQEQYEKTTGKRVDWLSPLPMLSMTESIGAIEFGRGIAKHIEEEAEKELGALKSQTKGEAGKRGKYLTERVVADVYSKVTAAWIAKIRPLGVLDSEWDSRMANALGELAPKSKALNLDDHDVPVYAAAMIARQYDKREGKS